MNTTHKQGFCYGIRCEEISLENGEVRFDPVTYFADGRNGYDVKFMSQDELITDMLRQYELYRALLNDKSNRLKTEEIN